MRRKLFYILLIAYSLTINAQVYKSDLPTLVRGYEPFKDSLIVLILAEAPGGSGDTTHFVLFTKVIGLQDTINNLRGLIGTGGFDTVFVYQRIAEKLAKLDFDDSLYNYIAFSFGNNDSLVTGGQVTGYVTGLGYAGWTAINDSNFVKTSETTDWDKISSDDMLAAAFDDSMANYISDVAYDATTWNGNPDAATKDAIRDKIETMGGGGDVVGDDVSTTSQNIVAYNSTGGKNITELTGTQGDVLYHNGTNWVKLGAGTVGQYLETGGAGANPSWQYGAVIHSSTSAGATTTGANTNPVSVNGAVFTYAASAVYKIWVMGRINSTAATTGIGLQFDLSSAVTAINVQFFHQLASTGTNTGGHSIADDASVGVSSGVPAGPIDVPFTGFGLLVTGANTGTCQLRLRAEVNAVTELMAGTVMVVERVN